MDNLQLDNSTFVSNVVFDIRFGKRIEIILSKNVEAIKALNFVRSLESRSK